MRILALASILPRAENIKSSATPFFHLCLSGEREPLTDKNKTDPGDLGNSLDPVYQSVDSASEGMKQPSIFCLFPLLFISVIGVNRENFKTCQTSSFCSRQRDVDPEHIRYFIEPGSLRISAFGLTANLSRNPGTQSLFIDISYLAFSTFRVLIDEPGIEPKRYRLPPGDSLRTEPKKYTIDVVRSEQSASLFGIANDKAIISLNPFRIDFYVDEVVVAQFNHRNLFNFENKYVTDARQDTETAEPLDRQVEDPSINLSGSSEAYEAPDHSVESLSGKNSEMDIAKDNDVLEHETASSSEQTEAHENEPEPTVNSPADPFPWSEEFKGHRDTRPFGPMSISMDIDFPGFSRAYGIPEHADSFVLKSTEGGDPYRLYNLDVFEYELNNPMALYGSVPIMWTLNENHTVGIFWHNPSETWVDVAYSDRPADSFLSKIPRLFTKSPEKHVKTRWLSESGVLDAFVVLGRDPHAVSRAFAHLIGTTPLPPLFALAYHQSRWNYNDEADVLSLDQRFDEVAIPLDVVWLDIEHTDGKRYFTWDNVKFPNPEDMVDTLNKKGRKLVTVVDPHIKQDSNWQLYNSAAGNNYYIKSREGSDYVGWCWPGSSAWPDFTSPVVRRWWSELFLTYGPIRVNTMFTWNDMGEPSIFNGPEITMHKDTIHEGNREHRDVHNIYGLQVHRATWEGLLLRSKNQERPFVLTRAFFAGSQRTAAVWTGDNTASWGHLQISTPMLLSLSLTGITLCGADVGGFFGNPEPELLTRWYQAAAFQPFFRSHAHIDTKRREPWTLPEEYMNAVREAVVERYNLLPYWYTTFARAEADGQPVMAPVWYHFRHMPSTYDLEDEYMIGEALLVRPVTSEGARYVDVYFPPGVWYHYPTLKDFDGNQKVHFPVGLSTIPAFYRGGWIVPRRQRVRRSSWLMQWDPFTLYVFIDPNSDRSHGYLYDDDYHSISRETAQFYRIEYEVDRDPLSNKVAGGRMRAHLLPLPGTTVLPQVNTSLRSVSIERIVFVGMQLPLQRVTLITGLGERKPVRFTQEPTDLADHKYFGERKEGVVITRHPWLILTTDWSLHLVTGTEMKSEL
ncbi:hypothetical protein T265_08783 [Opisthorchis viverrini]|uniref:Glucosidase II subunit alpha n=1 Tax=Opisthorchis viverrini TaxID=6198 RepID=A0A074Z864_OPIVI|nr:hypothetical protein T265_08783 [Opisthorchis viverrini]KER23298.1 hypothetical protein T265_08783 [Opisthorchis viverrini]